MFTHKSMIRNTFLSNMSINNNIKFFFFTKTTPSKYFNCSFNKPILMNNPINNLNGNKANFLLNNFSKKHFTIIDVSTNSSKTFSNFQSQNQNVSAVKKFVALDVRNLTDNPGAKKLKRRVGRGAGSSKGKTSARGHKIRGEPYRHFEGGQTNVFRRLPKHGFRTKKFKDEFAYINIQKILYLIHKGRLDATKPIGVKELFYAGGVSKVVDGIKLLSRGAENLKYFPKLDITVQSATEKAINAIKDNGGNITISHGTRLYNRYLLKPAKFTKELVEPYPSFKRVRRMLRLKDKGALTRFKEPLWMKENDLNDRIKRLKERLSKLKNAEILPEIPADTSPRTEQKIRPVRKSIYKKYNFESKL